MDTLADHSLRAWSFENGSVFYAEKILAGSTATLYLGLLSAGDGWELFSVNGGARMEFEPLDRFLIVASVIGGTVESYTPMSPGKQLEGTTLTIPNNGLLTLDFRGESVASYIKMEAIVISGKLEAGSIELEVDMMNVTTSGQLDVSGGGFESEKGPGTYEGLIVSVLLHSISFHHPNKKHKVK